MKKSVFMAVFSSRCCHFRLENFTEVPQLMLLHAAKSLRRTSKYCTNGNTLNQCPFSWNSKSLSLPPTPPKMGSRSGAPSYKPHDAGRAELPTPLRLNVGTAVLRLQGGLDWAVYGSIGDVANRFGTSRSTIWRIAQTFREQVDNGEGIDLSRHRKGYCSRKKKSSEEFVEVVEQSHNSSGHMSRVSLH